MSDSQVIANARRQAELEARHRDLTKPMPPTGSDGDSLRAVKGFEGITDEMLAERANFSPRKVVPGRAGTASEPINLTKLTAEQLAEVKSAIEQQLAMKEKQDA